jgi:two-component system NtrC family response regulator
VDKPGLLIVEDDDALCTQYHYALRDEYTLRVAGNRQGALKQFGEGRPAVVTLDLGLPPHAATADEGLRTLRELLALDASAKVIVITGNNDRANALRAIQMGACDYHLKPVNIDELRVVLRRAAYLHDVETQLRAQDPRGPSVRFEEIIGTTTKMREVFTTLAQVARTDATVLIQGESGTGKELAARAIHARSTRRQGPFVAINCGAIPETLLESELFGNEKGAYTGAHMQRKGKLELAQGGTLFLDEIGEMSLPLQVKLLRFLQERRLERVGGRESIAVDARVIAATNKDLKTEIQGGRFREDVYYRLSVVVLTMPPLRERDEDIVLLANAFLRKNCDQQGRRLRFSGRALETMTTYPWPGNVRELENAVQRGVIMARGRFIEPADLSIEPPLPANPLNLREARNHTERQMLVDALTRWQGNISRAARELGISRPAIHDLLNKHGVTAGHFRFSFSGREAAGGELAEGGE